LKVDSLDEEEAILW